MKVFFHIGLPKTGSSSIQSWCEENRDLLLEKGIHYPRLSARHGLFFAHLVDAAITDSLQRSYLARTHRPFTFDIEEAGRELLAKVEEHPSSDLLFSAEGFSTFSAGEMLRIKSFLDPYCSEYQVILYVRNPFDYASSMAQQRLKTGGVLGGERLPLQSVEKTLSVFSEVFGDQQILVRPFSRDLLTGGDVVVDFLSQLNPAIGEVCKASGSRRSNESLSLEASLILEKINLDCPFLLKDGPNPARSTRIVHDIRQISGRKFQLREISPEEEHRLRAQSEKLKERFGVPFEYRNPEKIDLFGEETISSIGRLINQLSLDSTRFHGGRKLGKAFRSVLRFRFRDAGNALKDALRLDPELGKRRSVRLLKRFIRVVG